MNQGRIWCVVNPTVGLPLFLGSVAITSLVVHASILTHVDWFGGYWEGGAKAKAALATPAPTVAPSAYKTDAGFTMSVAPAPAAANAPASFVITVTPNAPAATAPAVIHTASAD
jgi:light-harvesting protein B-800-850 alpha chain